MSPGKPRICYYLDLFTHPANSSAHFPLKGGGDFEKKEKNPQQNPKQQKASQQQLFASCKGFWVKCVQHQGKVTIQQCINHLKLHNLFHKLKRQHINNLVLHVSITCCWVTRCFPQHNEFSKKQEMMVFQEPPERQVGSKQHIPIFSGRAKSKAWELNKCCSKW